MSAENDRTLTVAESVAEVLARLGVETALIGAAALAVHGYARATKDLDLAARMPNPMETFGRCAAALTDAGYQVVVSNPDADDSLGGVIRVLGADFKPIEIINFYNWKSTRPSTVGDQAVRAAQPVPGVAIPTVDLAHLIALKLYGGGRKGEQDIFELLERNPDADRDAIRAVCRKHHLDRKFDRLLADLERDPEA